MSKPQISIQACHNINLGDLESNVNSLRSRRLDLAPRPTARPLSGDILEKVSEIELGHVELEDADEEEEPSSVSRISHHTQLENSVSEVFTEEDRCRQRIHQLIKHRIIDTHTLGDTELLQDTATTKTHLLNIVYFGGLVLFMALGVGVLCYKMYYNVTQLSGALIIIAFISMLLELFIYRPIAWCIYLPIYKHYNKKRLLRQLELYMMRKLLLQAISRNPGEFKDWFKAYQQDYLYSVCEGKERNELLGTQNLFLEDDPEFIIAQKRTIFDPLTDLDKELATKRAINRSDEDMEDGQFPEFNSEVPIFSENDKHARAEMTKFNKMLKDIMKTAYNDHLDNMIKRRNTDDFEGQEAHGEAQHIPLDVFDIIEEQTEEEKQPPKKNKKKLNASSGLPASYYRDIAMIMAKRDLIKKNKKKRLNSSVDVQSQNDSKYKKKGIYALDQLNPLKKQDIYIQEERKVHKPKPQTREIPRAQILVFAESPKIEIDGLSSEPVDAEHIKFQSAEKSAGTSTKLDQRYKLASFQEQPNRFANSKKRRNEIEKSPLRKITVDHFSAAKNKLSKREFGMFQVIICIDGETTESVPLSMNPSEKGIDEIHPSKHEFSKNMELICR